MRLQNIIATTVLVLGLSTVKTDNAHATISNNQLQPVSSNVERSRNTASIKYEIAQASKEQDAVSDDEMLDALQERQKKIDRNLEKIRKITGAEAESKTPSSEDDSQTGDEMLDALQNRQDKINDLKELKNLKDKIENDSKNEEILNTLQKSNFNVNSLEELLELKQIVNDENLTQEQMLDTLQNREFNVNSLKEVTQIQKLVAINSPRVVESPQFSQIFAFRLLTVGLPASILMFFVGTPIIKGVIKVVSDNVQEKYGKPKVPEGSVTSHNKSFKEICLVGKKAEKVNDEKFGNEEFLLLLSIKINISKGIEDYQKLNYGIELLSAAITARKSFLRLEQTELKYRSRKQQEFYRYVAEHLEEDVDRAAFVQQIKQKQVEILPSINSEEGKAAINTYAEQIGILGRYPLGLKLLAMFKKRQMQGSVAIKNISDVVEGLQGASLISSDNLISPVLENYESFELLGPILGIPEKESNPKIYAKILQVLGLTNRHEKAYGEFKQLVKLLKKWEKLEQSISIFRNEYTEDKYSIPPEFKEDIPGTSTYQKYAKYLADL